MRQSAEQDGGPVLLGDLLGPAGDPLARPGQGSRLPGRGAQARALPLLPGGDVLRWKPHTLSLRRGAGRRRGGQHPELGQRRLRHPEQRRPPVPHREALGGRGGPDRRVGLRASPRLARAGGSRPRLRCVLRRAEGLFPHHGGDAPRPDERHTSSRRPCCKFDSCLDSALFRAPFPPRSTPSCSWTCAGTCPTLHRYLDLRKRMLGLPTLRYQDLYVPLVGQRRSAVRAGRGPGHHARGLRSAREGVRGGPPEGLREPLDRLPPVDRASAPAPTPPACTASTLTSSSTSTASTTTSPRSPTSRAIRCTRRSPTRTSPTRRRTTRSSWRRWRPR